MGEIGKGKNLKEPSQFGNDEEKISFNWGDNETEDEKTFRGKKRNRKGGWKKILRKKYLDATCS